MGRRALYVQTDVSDRASVQAMVERCLDEYGRIDFLMNNAGITKWCEAENVSEADWRAVIDVNLNGLFFCCQAVAPAMIEQGKGSIVNIASMSGLIVNRPQPQTSYNTSKAAVIHLTKSLAAEWAPHQYPRQRHRAGLYGHPDGAALFRGPAVWRGVDGRDPDETSRQAGRAGAGRRLFGLRGVQLCHRHDDRGRRGLYGLVRRGLVWSGARGRPVSCSGECL